MFIKIGVPKMFVTEKAIFRNSYFQRTPLTGCYCILLEPEPPVFQNIANHSTDFTKKFNQEYLKRVFNSNILWNLEFAMFDFIRYKTLAYRARFPYSSLMLTKQNKICLLWFTTFTVFASFMQNRHHNFFPTMTLTISL